MKPAAPNQILKDIHASLECDALADTHKVFLRDSLDRYLSYKKRHDLTRAFGLKPIRRGRSERKARVLGEPKWSEKGLINDAGIGQLIFEIETGDAHPDDVVAALKAIHSALHGRQIFSRRMLGYLGVALRRYLQGDLTMEQAFGLKRSAKGRPGLPIERRQAIAGFVLLQCLRPTNRLGLRGAATVVGRAHGIGTTQVLDCWRKHKGEAIPLAKRELSKKRSGPKEGPPWKWNPQEQRVLRSLFARDNAKIFRL
jgi:hypothetical protein